MNNITVLYYTSNRENEKFEEKVRRNILKLKGDLPLISVSQKPLNFGRNICVGVQDNCYGNEFRQIQIGLKEVHTEYVLCAESDVLYPPEYFQFEPTGADYYRYSNVWVHYARPPKRKNEPQVVLFKRFSDGAQLLKTKFWSDLIDKNIGTGDHWFTTADILPRFTLETIPGLVWGNDHPVITYKTLSNVSRKTSLQKNHPPREELPYWGNIAKLNKRIFIR